MAQIYNYSPFRYNEVLSYNNKLFTILVAYDPEIDDYDYSKIYLFSSNDSGESWEIESVAELPYANYNLFSSSRFFIDNNGIIYFFNYVYDGQEYKVVWLKYDNEVWVRGEDLIPPEYLSSYFPIYHQGNINVVACYYTFMEGGVKIVIKNYLLGGQGWQEEQISEINISGSEGSCVTRIKAIPYNNYFDVIFAIFSTFIINGEEIKNNKIYRYTKNSQGWQEEIIYEFSENISHVFLSFLNILSSYTKGDSYSLLVQDFDTDNLKSYVKKIIVPSLDIEILHESPLVEYEGEYFPLIFLPSVSFDVRGVEYFAYSYLDFDTLKILLMISYNDGNGWTEPQMINSSDFWNEVIGVISENKRIDHYSGAIIVIDARYYGEERAFNTEIIMYEYLPAQQEEGDIEVLSPSSGPVNKIVEISGSGFGNQKADSRVVFEREGKLYFPEVISWQDNLVKCYTPEVEELGNYNVYIQIVNK